jgi:hypothetical protein
MNEPSDILQRQFIVLFHQEPEPVQHAYQTRVEPVTDIAAFETKARELLNSFEIAARGDRLGLYERWNLLVGTPGLIIGEGWQPRDVVVTNTLAELLSDAPHELDDIAKERFDYFCWCALHQDLSAVVHAMGDSRVAFAAVVNKTDDDLELDYLARLLVTDGDVLQWSGR